MMKILFTILWWVTTIGPVCSLIYWAGRKICAVIDWVFKQIWRGITYPFRKLLSLFDRNPYKKDMEGLMTKGDFHTYMERQSYAIGTGGSRYSVEDVFCKMSKGDKKLYLWLCSQVYRLWKGHVPNTWGHRHGSEFNYGAKYK